MPPERWNPPKTPAEKSATSVERPKNAWEVLDRDVEAGRITRITLQAGPANEGYGYHHAFVSRLENGDFGVIGIPNTLTINHSVGGSQEGLQYRDDPTRSIEEKIEPAFMAVVHKDGSVEGDIPAEYGDLTKTVKSFGYFYDRGVLGKFKGASFLEAPSRQIPPPAEE